jgi:hypothetical protein
MMPRSKQSKRAIKKRLAVASNAIPYVSTGSGTNVYQNINSDQRFLYSWLWLSVVSAVLYTHRLWYVDNQQQLTELLLHRYR